MSEGDVTSERWEERGKKRVIRTKYRRRRRVKDDEDRSRETRVANRSRRTDRRRRSPWNKKKENQTSARARDKGKEDMSGSGHPALPLSLRHPLAFLTPSSLAARILTLSRPLSLTLVRSSCSTLLPLLLYSTTTPHRGVLVLRDLAPRADEACTKASSSDRFSIFCRARFSEIFASRRWRTISFLFDYI